MTRLRPIIKREIELKSRSYAVPAVMLAANAVLFLAGLAGVSGIVLSAKENYILDYGGFLRVYLLVAALECLLVLLAAPMYTLGSISGERERGTFDLLLTTSLTAEEIVLEKLVSAALSVGTLVISCLPALLIPLMSGGIPVRSAVLLMLLFLWEAAFGLCIGMFASSLAESSVKSMAIAYALVFGLIVAPILIAGLAGRVSPPAGNRTVGLLSIDPLLPVCALLLTQTGESHILTGLWMLLKAAPETAAMRHPVQTAVTAQAILGLGFVTAAILRTRPEGLRMLLRRAQGENPT